MLSHFGFPLCLSFCLLPSLSLSLSESPISIVGKASSCNIFLMAADQDKGRPLPKFGEWDVNNPASAEGFSVIFSKARDEKKSNDQAAAAGVRAPSQRTSRPNENYQHPPPMKKWFCCF